MQGRHNGTSLALLTLIASLALAIGARQLGAAEDPVPVAPGGIEAPTTIADRCPTFTWAGPDDPRAQQLAVFRVPASGGELVEPLLLESLPAGARAWTPRADRCLDVEGELGWAIRYVEEGAPTSWSALRRFEVEAPPARGTLEWALEVVRRSLATDSDHAGRLEETELDRIRVTVAAPAAISALPDLGRGIRRPAAGDLAGSALVVHSNGSAAVLAANLDSGGGVDLALDGAAQGAVDARYTQTGIDLISPLPQSYDVLNSGSGDMVLTVDGDPVITTDNDNDSLGDLTCSDGEIAVFQGGLWQCSPPP